MKAFLKKYYPILIFSICLIGLGIHYNYNEIFNYKPQSIHKWRQTDCTSIALNYYQHGMNFFKPELHSQLSDARTTGYAVSEFPILYYIVAILYKIFGYDESVYRIFFTLIAFLGLFYLFKLFRLFVKDVFFSIVVPLIFLTSPIYIYYANNFLVDIPALSFAIMGWYYFFLFYFEKINKYFVIAAIVFLFAGLIKITALMSFIVIFIIFLNERLKIISAWNFNVFKNKSKSYIIMFASVFILVASWYLYAIYYNSIHGTGIFSTQTWPLWSLDAETIHVIIKDIKEFWNTQYFNISVLLFLLMSFVIIIIKVKKQIPILIFITCILFIGIVLFVILWFFAMSHDYYYLNLMVLPVFILITLFSYIENHELNFSKSFSLKLFFLLFLIYNVNYAKNQLGYRYSNQCWYNDYDNYKSLVNIKSYLKSIGVKPNDRIISLPDFTPNYSLYLMNQPGWTNFGDLNNDSISIQKNISVGAKYLIVTDENTNKFKYLKSFKYHQVGQFNKIYIYKLDGKADDSYMKSRIIQEIYFDAEKTIIDENYFINAFNNSRLFPVGGFQSSDCFHAGKMSLMLTKSMIYSPTFVFNNIKKNDEFRIVFWKKGNSINSSLVAGFNDPSIFYKNTNESNFNIEENNWKRYSIEFSIPTQPKDSILNIYFWNPDGENVYFDDLKILRYKAPVGITE